MTSNVSDKARSIPKRWDKPSDEEIDQYYHGMRAFWHSVLPVADLPTDRPVGIELLGEKIVLARLNNDIVAMQDLCRHFQSQLSIGEIQTLANGQQCLMCKYHGWHYNNDGQCVHIPQLLPGRDIPREARVPTYHVAERHALIWICLADNPTYEIPEFPEISDPDFRSGPLRVYEPWTTSAPRAIMGALDDTHFPWVHEHVLGDRSSVAAPDHEVWRDGRYLVSRYSILQPRNVTISQGEQATEPALDTVTYTNYVGIPNVIRLIKDSNDGKKYAIWLATNPIRYNLTQTFWRVARNYDMDPTHDQVYEDFEDMVRAQDKPVVESQRPWLLPPFWTHMELPLRPADIPLIEYQRWLEELDIMLTV
jgi:phenylpropionate dioxygenase-like ring-hydroxylating dioxygenase large terminal subunit